MIDILEKEGIFYCTSKEIDELDRLMEFLAEIFPDAKTKKARWDKEIKLNLMEIDIAEDMTKKDLKDLLNIYKASR